MTPFGEASRQIVQRVHSRLDAFRHPDATPLMLSWRLIITEDNRSGILAGTDKDGHPLKPVTYRPKGKTINFRSGKASRLRHHQRANRLRDLLFAGAGPWASGLHNNLSPAEYRRLTGPPLAPRGQFSRVIANLVTGHEPLNPTPETRVWTAFGAWRDVISTTGFAFLPVHFNGLPLGKHGPSIRRDLRGIRPEGQRRLIEAYDAWARDWLQSILNA